MNGKDGKRLSLEVQTQKSLLNVERAEFRRYSSGSFKEHKPKHMISVQYETGVTDGKKSPTPSLTIKHQRAKDSNSSQESLPSPVLPRMSPFASSTELKESDDEAKEESPLNNSSNGSRNGSPDKPLNTFQTSNNGSISDGGEPSFIEYGVNCESEQLNNSYEKRPSSAQDNYEMSYTSEGIRERSFERSLDNILDKCSKISDFNISVDSSNSSIQDGGKSPDQNSGSSGIKASKSDKKRYRWYNIMATPTYKSRSEDYRRMFKDVPKDERLIVDYSCALQKDILVQGRMFMSQNWICFYAKIFNWETMLMIQCKEITAITKEKTARVIPNAIQITTEKERYFFTSFGTRDKTYLMLFRIWQNALLDQPMSAKELWTWVHYSYGDDLGLTTEDDDYIAPQCLEDLSEKLKDDNPLEKDQTTDSEAATTTAENNQTGSTEDTDAFISDEVFNSSSWAPPNHLPDVSTDVPVMGASFLNSSDDSQGEYFCDSHDHLEKMYLDEVFNINIDTVFEDLFTDSTFLRNFVGSRKTFDLNLQNWEEEADENGNKVRNISYTLTLNNSIGPRTSPSTEKQIYYSMSRPGRIYHVDCECCNGGIPYADSFYMLLRYCLTRVSSTKCRVVVTGELKYKKHIMAMFKSMIEKSAVSGLTDYFRQLSVHLRHEAQLKEAIVVSHQKSVPKKKMRRKRTRTHTCAPDSGAAYSYSERQTSAPPSPLKALHKEDKLIELNTHTLIRIIIVILVLLLLFNAVLFYKLWSLESYASSLFGIPSQEALDNLAKYPRTSEEWSQILLQQKQLHESEINRWEEVLSACIKIVEQMKTSLITLQKSMKAGTHSHDES